MSLRIYVASSWRNTEQPNAVGCLRSAGHAVYDFRTGEGGFHWSEIDPAWKSWTTGKFCMALSTPKVQAAHTIDQKHLDWADVCVLVRPCGISSHIEAGYMAGKGKPVYVFTKEKNMDPELMYLTLGPICTQYDQLMRMIVEDERST